MRKVLLIVSLLAVGLAKAQTPSLPSIVHRSKSMNTVGEARLMAELNLFVPRYADTTTANTAYNIGIDTCGAIISTFDNVMWKRDCNPKRWVKIGSGWQLEGNTVKDGDVLGALNGRSVRLISNNTNYWTLDSTGVFVIGTYARATGHSSKLETDGSIRSGIGYSLVSPLVPGEDKSGMYAGGTLGAVSFWSGNDEVLGLDHPQAQMKLGSLFAFSSGNSAYSAFNINTEINSSGGSNSNQYTLLKIDPIINQGGTGTGAIRGIYYNPTILSMNTSPHFAYENVTGHNYLNTTSGSTMIGYATGGGTPATYKFDENGRARFTGTFNGTPSDYNVLINPTIIPPPNAWDGGAGLRVTPTFTATANWQNNTAVYISPTWNSGSYTYHPDVMPAAVQIDSRMGGLNIYQSAQPPGSSAQFTPTGSYAGQPLHINQSTSVTNKESIRLSRQQDHVNYAPFIYINDSRGTSIQNQVIPLFRWEGGGVNSTVKAGGGISITMDRRYYGRENSIEMYYTADVTGNQSAQTAIHLRPSNTNNGLRVLNGGVVSINAATADASAILDIASTNKGVLLPRMTKAQRDAIVAPAPFLLVAVTDNGGYLSFYNAGWQKVSSIADP